jgi:hypothetical protein
MAVEMAEPCKAWNGEAVPPFAPFLGRRRCCRRLPHSPSPWRRVIYVKTQIHKGKQWLEADAEVVLLSDRLCKFRRRYFFGSGEILLRLIGVQSEIRFRKNALEGLLGKAIACCDHTFCAKVLQAIDGVAVVDVAGLL